MKFLKVIISTMLLGSYVFLMCLLGHLGLYESKYILFISTLVLVFIIMLICLIFELKSKLKILCFIIGIVFLLIIITTLYFLNTTISFIKTSSKVVVNYDNYYQISLKGNDKNEKVGILDDMFLSEGSKIYEDRYELYSDLINKKIDSIIISDVDLYFIEKEDKDFINKIKVIDIIKQEREKVKYTTKEITKESFIIYISGIDTDGVISKVSRSDVNIIVVVNPNTHQMLLVNIPRDYYVNLHGKDAKDKLTHAGLYGIDTSIKTIEDLLNININYYVRINFDSVVKVVDEIGGIDITSDQDLNFCGIKKGINHVDGACALRYARERKSYLSGDRHRGENQQEVIKAVLNKIKKNKLLIFKYPIILNKLKNNFETNIKNDDIKDFIKKDIKYLPKWVIKSYNLNGSDSKNYTYSMGKKRMLYVMEPDYNTVLKAKELINDVLNNKEIK